MFYHLPNEFGVVSYNWFGLPPALEVMTVAVPLPLNGRVDVVRRDEFSITGQLGR